MRVSWTTFFVTLMAISVSTAFAQPGGGEKDGGRGRGGPGGTVEAGVKRLMAYDEDKNGELSADEMKEDRLKALFERADADKSGSVTTQELTDMFTKDAANRRGGPGGGPGGPGGGRGFAPPRPGVLLPPFLREQLNLTPEQQTAIDDLQKEVDEKMAKILTDEQRKQITEMGQRFGRGGPGGPGGGPRGEGGGPGGAEGGRPRRPAE